MKVILVAALAAAFVAPGFVAARPGPGKTPPGLAKKGGLPPGQAKKMWTAGESLPRSYYTQPRYYVANPSAYTLPPAPYGSRWVRVGDAYYLARTETGAILDVVSALTR